MRLITVVMGEENTDKRTADTLAMMDYGFNFYYLDPIVKKDDSLGKIKISLGNQEYVDISSKKDINILNKIDKSKKNITYEIKTDDIVAPVKIGDTIGKIAVYENNKYLYDVDITVKNNIKKTNIFNIIIRNIRDILTISI